MNLASSKSFFLSFFLLNGLNANPDINSSDYYAILGVQKKAAKTEIHKAYTKLSLKYHPDKFSGPGFTEEQRTEATENFKKINKAKETLLDPQLRQIYDHCGLRAIREEEKKPDQEFVPTADDKKDAITHYVNLLMKNHKMRLGLCVGFPLILIGSGIGVIIGSYKLFRAFFSKKLYKTIKQNGRKKTVEITEAKEKKTTRYKLLRKAGLIVFASTAVQLIYNYSLRRSLANQEFLNCLINIHALAQSI